MRGRHVDGELVLLWNVDLSEAELVRDGRWPAGPLLLRDGDAGHVASVHLDVQHCLCRCKNIIIVPDSIFVLALDYLAVPCSF